MKWMLLASGKHDHSFFEMAGCHIYGTLSEIYSCD